MIARIKEMEARYDELTRVLGELESAIAEYKTFKGDLDILRGYMDSGQWKEDFEADEAGRIPDGVKRGVLSEDGLYDLLRDSDRILEMAREL